MMETNTVLLPPEPLPVKIPKVKAPKLDLQWTRKSSEGAKHYRYTHLIGDVLSACISTAIVSPLITSVDQAIVQRSANTKINLWNATFDNFLTILAKPSAYFRSPSFLYMWLCYASTYTTANILTTIAPEFVFAGTTAVNSGTSILKDQAYARMYSGAVQSVPKISYGFWVTRDITVIGSTFVLPKALKETYHVNETMTRFLSPLLAQVAGAPLHFLGLDCFNRPGVHWSGRIVALQSAYFDMLTARMARILPGYSICGVTNEKLKNGFKNWFDDHHQSLLIE